MNIKKAFLSIISGFILSQLFIGAAGKVYAQAWYDLFAPWIPGEMDITARDPIDIVLQVIRWILLVAGIVAVVFFIWGGILYITSAGDAEKATKGRSTIINALIGLVIILMAFGVARWITVALGA